MTIEYSFLLGIGPMPTSPKVKEKLFLLIPALGEGPIVELGAGWGTLAIPLAKRYPEREVIAYELSLLPFWTLWLLKQARQVPNLNVMRKDFFKKSLSGSALVVCYLYPGAMEKLESKFSKELKGFVLSHTFALRKQKPLATAHAKDLYRTPIFLYDFSDNSASLVPHESAP
jgi:hypothetical protein